MNVFGFVVSLILFIGGMVVMGSAFYAVGYQGPVFFLGILTTTSGLILPVHILKRIDG